MVARFYAHHYHGWNDGEGQEGSVGFDCSKIWVSCAGFANHNGVLFVNNSSGTRLTNIVLTTNGNYEWSGSGIRSWVLSYNYPSGYGTISYSYDIKIYY